MVSSNIFLNKISLFNSYIYIVMVFDNNHIPLLLLYYPILVVCNITIRLDYNI